MKLKKYQQVNLENKAIEFRKKVDVFQRSIEPIFKVFSENIKTEELNYNRNFESIVHWLKYNGKILPLGFDDFIWWLLIEKYNQEYFFPIPEITDKDFIDYHKYRLSKLSPRKVNKISARDVALFCDIINDSGIIKQGELNKESYCELVIKKFNFNANPDTVRRHYLEYLDLKSSSKNLDAINELIIPNLPNDIKNKVKTFINTHTNYYS
jgi:hypothetical protein